MMGSFNPCNGTVDNLENKVYWTNFKDMGRKKLWGIQGIVKELITKEKEKGNITSLWPSKQYIKKKITHEC